MRDSLLDDPAIDPALAAVLADMYRRWPTLARDADHPLAEFFLRRRRRFDLRRPLATIAAVTFFITAMNYIPKFAGISMVGSVKFILLFLIARWIYRKLLATGPSTGLDSPIDLLARLRQPGDCAERFTPISPLQLPAIHAAVELCRHRRLRSRVMRMIFFFLLPTPVVLAPLWYYLVQDLAVTAIAPLAGLTALLGVLAGAFLGEHRCVLRSLHRVSSNSEPGKEVGCITGFFFLAMMCAAFAVVMNHAFQVVDVPFFDFIPPLLAFLLIGSAVSLFTDLRRRASRVDKYYRELLDEMRMDANLRSESLFVMKERDVTRDG